MFPYKWYGKETEAVDDEIKYLAQKQLSYLEQISEVDCNLIDLEDRSFVAIRDGHSFCCQICKMNGNGKCDCLNTHSYGAYEAQRWDGKYIYYCPLGLIFISNALLDQSHQLTGAFTLGPIVMAENFDSIPFIDDYYIKRLPHLSTTKVNALCELAVSVSQFISYDQGDYERRVESNEDLRNLLYQEHGCQDDDKQQYEFIVANEREIRSLILAKDKVGAQELLNKMLGQIYFSSSGDFYTIRARAVELVVLLSRAAIDGGADVKEVFGLNTGFIKETQTFHNIEDLSRWLTNVIHCFISCVFDFNEVKHMDIMYKVQEYINLHYREKINLGDVADYVFLSKSYLSKIFKDEMKCNLTNYINKLRVEKSKTFLLRNNVSLVDIANSVGFDDQSYFTKVFKKVTGISPGKYRETHGNIVA